MLPKRFPIAFQVDYENAFNDKYSTRGKKDIDKSGKKQAIIWRINNIQTPQKDRTRNTCRGRDAYEQEKAGGVRQVRSGK